ncbi:MAG TPA: toxic anion resistance protein [Candidatus Thiothrix moscowensis]|uniref:toxic anion resistance protein n=1 Tax=unclassified Thiothrix TaxID=2636184 RepID=UPI0025E5BB7E|nr:MULTISPECIES: toxic anion resistance protein [unclassified Thiothrix]HRJ53273.1 toxic anion resistance protein [Candidatus Thiothrix moscowensis]HRJ93157.1 toxic anion resistance protein [Candidatus Thiothrix moscowensis]
MNETQTTTTVQTAPAIIPGTELAPLPEMTTELVAYSQAPTQLQQEMESIIAEINMTDRSSIMFFGTKTQEQMTTISEKMLNGVKNKDIGSAGKSLTNMITAIKGFDIDSLNPDDEPSWWEKLIGKTKPVVEFLSKYEDVRKQIDTITDEMEGHKTQLLTDVVTLDKLYEANLDFFHKLEAYISAGDEKLKRLDSNDIPKLVAEVQAKTEDLVLAQNLRDLRSARDDLERRVHDLRLTRQVAMQSLPSIRLVQENDKTLINKINSTLINTVPLWKNQLAQAVTIFRMSDAAKVVKEASDLTNELLEKNAETLRLGNEETRKQMERGVFDIESVKKANQTLIDTINDSLRIADEGKTMRAKAEEELKVMEGELRQALISAKAKSDSPRQGA